MNIAFKALQEAITEIQEQQQYEPVPIIESSELVGDIGLQSLDIAQLVAMLEVKLEKDPFANGATLESISTAGQLSKLYE